MKYNATFVAGGAAATALLVGDSIAAAKNQGRIAFARNGQIYITKPGRLRPEASSPPGERPEATSGSRIVFERGKGLWIMDSNGSHQHVVVSNGRAPDWSPV